MKKLNRNFLATIGGLLTSLGVASVIDWDNFDFSNPAHLCKLGVVVLPALGGWLSELKGKK